MRRITESEINHHAAAAHAQPGARQGCLFRQPSSAGRGGDAIPLRIDEDALAKFGILPGGRLEPSED